MNAPTRFGPAGIPAGMDPQEWRRAIEAEVDKLLDRADALVVALDAMEADSDLEDTGDGEESLGWGEVGPKPFNQANVGEREADGTDDEHTLGWTEDQSACGRLSGGFYAHKDGELEPELGFTEEVDQQRRIQTAPGHGDVDGELSLGWKNEGDQSRLFAADHDLEPDLGTTEEVDQVRRNEGHGRSFSWIPGDAEPSLGFVGHGTGWREGETVAEENGDEGDCDGGETDTPGFIAGGNEEGERSHSYGHAATGPAMFDGSGSAKAADALLNAGPRSVPEVTPTIGERCHVLPSGDVMRTAVPYQSGYVRPSGALPDEDGPDMTDFSAYAPRRGGDREDRP